MKVVFRKGVEANLPSSAPSNELFFSEDKCRIYKGMGTSEPLVRFSDVMHFDALESLQAHTGVIGKLYIVGKALYVYDGVAYQEIGGTGGIITHEHTNKSVIDKFGLDTDGNLLFDGKQIESVNSQVLVKDIGITDLKMTVTYSDDTTKELTIQGGSKPTNGFVTKEYGSTEW